MASHLSPWSSFPISNCISVTLSAIAVVTFLEVVAAVGGGDGGDGSEVLLILLLVVIGICERRVLFVGVEVAGTGGRFVRKKG